MRGAGRYDVFISHASEDKAAVARPLSKRLKQLGLTVWLDEFELRLGDSLRRSIDHGLANSRFGVVILSKTFFSKEWPQRELDALANRVDRNVILPVWHRLTASGIRKLSPLLADRVAVSTTSGIPFIADEILKVVHPSSSRKLAARLKHRPSWIKLEKPGFKIEIAASRADLVFSTEQARLPAYQDRFAEARYAKLEKAAQASRLHPTLLNLAVRVSCIDSWFGLGVQPDQFWLHWEIYDHDAIPISGNGFVEDGGVLWTVNQMVTPRKNPTLLLPAAHDRDFLALGGLSICTPRRSRLLRRTGVLEFQLSIRRRDEFAAVKHVQLVDPFA